MKKGMFITFEGIEGAGKTTQIERIARFLTDRGHKVIVTKEPGGTRFGQHIRKLILDPDSAFSSKYTELLLFYADRLEHVEQVIKPSLNNGIIVLCDRYVDSTIAYQLGARNMPEELVAALNKWVPLMPDLTLLLDISPEAGLARVHKRDVPDRFEKEALTFHHRVRNTYLALAEKEPARIKSVPVDGLTAEEVFNRLVPFVETLVTARNTSL